MKFVALTAFYVGSSNIFPPFSQIMVENHSNIGSYEEIKELEGGLKS